MLRFNSYIFKIIFKQFQKHLLLLTMTIIEHALNNIEIIFESIENVLTPINLFRITILQTWNQFHLFDFHLIQDFRQFLIQLFFPTHFHHKTYNHKFQTIIA